MAKTNLSRYLNPAEYVILVFGGASIVGKHIGRNRTSVWKWKAYEGVPRQHHKTLLEVAKKQKIDLTAQDLISGRTLRK